MTNNNKNWQPDGDLIASTGQAKFSRREILHSSLAAGSVGMLPLVAASCATPMAQVAAVPTVLDEQTESILTAFINRIIPTDASGPGAGDAGVARYINRSLMEWNQGDITLITEGLQQLDGVASARFGQTFTQLSAPDQDELLVSMEAGTLETFTTAQALFNRLYRLTLEGMFSDPYYGGNANYAGWDLIGYPGAVLGSSTDMQKMGGRLPALHTSAYGEAHDGH